MEEMFDLETYVRQRLGEIEDIDERKFAKEILLKGLVPILELTEKRYLGLEERVKREVEVSDEKYVVYMNVIQEKDYDPTNSTLFPVCQKVPYLIYFTGTLQQRQEFEKKKEWQACDEEGQERRVRIRRAECYQNALKELYEVFVYNHIRWTTVHTGHLDRFYEVYPLEEETDISGWKIDFGTMQDQIQTGMIPLWNIEKFRFQCMKFMVPCVDDKYYEHELDLKDYDADSGYMMGINEEVQSIRYERDKIIMTSLKESFRNWTAYRFAARVDTSSYGYKGLMLTNRRKQSFSDSYIRRQKQIFFSRTELFREIGGFELGDYVELKDCLVEEELPKEYLYGNMNSFIREEIFPMDGRKILVLRFQKTAGDDAICEDMVRFAVSQMQLLLNEYQCVGILE